MSKKDLAARRLLAVTEEELQRIVLDIHDGPVQNLFAALSQLALLRGHLSALPDLPAECGLTVNRSIELLEVSLRDIRDLLGAFRTPQFASSSLREIVEDLAIQYEALKSGMVTLEMVEPLPDNLSLPAKIALCRIMQESLSNVHRHSGVRQATIKLWMEKDRLVVEISDQGRGFEPPPLSGPQATEQHEHIGLRGMRERAELVGGSLQVESHPGAGTRVRVEVPANE